MRRGLGKVGHEKGRVDMIEMWGVCVCVIKWLAFSLTSGVPKNLGVGTVSQSRSPLLPRSPALGLSQCCRGGSSTEHGGSCFLGCVMIVVSLLLSPQ